MEACSRYPEVSQTLVMQPHDVPRKRSSDDALRLQGVWLSPKLCEDVHALLHTHETYNLRRDQLSFETHARG